MLSVLGYNFCLDIDALNPTPTNLDGITNTVLKNGIYDHYNVTRNVTAPYSSDIPTVWDYLTAMDANFNGNISAGNVDFIMNQISSIRVKRRESGSFFWLTLYDIPINSIEDFSFEKFDMMNKHGVVYEYAFVPVLDGTEGNYITNSVESKFNGVFICDQETIFKFYADVNFGSVEQTHLTGVYEPLGSKYPIVVSNSLVNYKKSSFSGLAITKDAFDKGFDRIRQTSYRNELLSFLTNSRAKVIKDWNGDIILMVVVGSPTLTPVNPTGGALASVAFNYNEIGDANNQEDLYNAGISDVGYSNDVWGG